MRKLELRNMNRPIETLQYWSERDSAQELLLDPPYQRGDVWGVERRRNLIRSILLGLPIGALIFNDRFSAEWKGPKAESLKMAVIDGRQRITTLLLFMRGGL